jgi:hypothetical protein
VMAPGNVILSSLPGGKYGSMSGTTMAASHVAGLVALIWQAAPSLKNHIPETITAIKANAVPLVGQTGTNCEGNYTTGSNNDWGVGTTDAKAIVDSVAEGIINGTATMAVEGSPISNVTITVGTYHTTTADDGTYTLNLPNGTYMVIAQKGGWATQVRTGLVVTARASTTVNFPLDPTVMTTVNGVVSDGTTGGHNFPLYAKIAFDTPGQTTVTGFTNPFSGAYTVTLLKDTLYLATITTSPLGYPVTMVNFTATSDPFTQNFYLQANLMVCNAPGYSNNKVFSENFDVVSAPALPSSWFVAQTSGTTANWYTAINSSHPARIEPVSYSNMVIFNSYSANDTDKAILYTNTSTSLTSLSNAVVSFWMYHDTGYSSSQDKVQVAVSTNGSIFYLQGSAILRYSDTPGWVYHQVDISSYAGPGKPAVFIGLVGTSAYGNDIHIDDISISSLTCQTLNGGMLSGFVSSAPSGRPIISALVASATYPSEQAYSLSRGEDFAISDGLYQLFSSATGSQNFTATAIRHQWDAKITNVVNNGVTRLDLAPTSAWITASPNPVIFALPMNTSNNVNLILSNTGPIPSNYTIQSAASALTSGSTSSGPLFYNDTPANDPSGIQSVTVNGEQPNDNLPDSTLSSLFPYNEEPVNGPTDTQNENANENLPNPNLPDINPVPTEGDEILGGGPRLFGVTTPFPGTAGYHYATASCDGDTFYVIGGQTGSTAVNEVWFYNPDGNTWTAKAPLPQPSANMRAACIDGKIYVVGGSNSGAWNNNFQIYDTLTGSWTSTTQPFTGAPMVVAYNGLLYAMGGDTSAGASNQARMYNPVSGLWTILANLPTAASYSGAVVYKNLIFIIGGSATADVQAYNPASNTWDNSGPDLPGPRMDPVVGWYGDYIYLLNGGGNGSLLKAYPEGYVLYASVWPGGSWTMISPTVLKPKSESGSICAGNRLWSVGGLVSGYEEHITQYYDAGLMCNRTYPAVPWLTVVPQSGTIPQGGSSIVTLTFNAGVPSYNTPGVYHAVLKVNSDAPYVMPDIPVTMVVYKTSTAVSVTPSYGIKPVFPHKYASYDYIVKNISGATDSFTVVALGISPGWAAIINPPGFTDLPNNGTASFNIKLYPPGAAKDGAEGVVTLEIRVHDNANQGASLSAIATVQFMKLFFPVVTR